MKAFIISVLVLTANTAFAGLSCYIRAGEPQVQGRVGISQGSSGELRPYSQVTFDGNVLRDVEFTNIEVNRDWVAFSIRANDLPSDLHATVRWRAEGGYAVGFVQADFLERAQWIRCRGSRLR